MKLYEIDQGIESCIDPETGEIIDLEMLDHLMMERDRKIENVALWVKNLKAEAEALKKEKMVFADRQKVAENKIKSLEYYLARATDHTPFKTDRVDIRFRRSEAVVVSDDADINALPEALKTVSVTPNKTEIKKALKDGAEFKGFTLETRQNIQIR